MAEEVLNLIARITPDGADETTEALDDARDSFEETADTADEESQRLERFSERFKGALSIAVAGLGIAAAGLLSQVPVIGESVAGLSAILQSLGLVISDTLRPSLTGLNQSLFELADAIASTEGQRRSIIGFASTLATITAGAVAGITFLVSGIVGLAAGVSLLATGLALAVTEFAGLTNFTNIAQTEFNGLLGVLQDVLTVGLAPLVVGLSAIQGFFDGGLPGAIANTREALFTIGDAFADLVIRLGTLSAKALLLIKENFGLAFDFVVKFAKEAFNTVVRTVQRGVNGIIRAISGLPGIGDISEVDLSRFTTETRSTQEIISSRQASISQARQQINAFGSAAREGNALKRIADVLDDIQGERTSPTIVEIGGREVARQTGDFLGEGTANRGR